MSRLWRKLVAVPCVFTLLPVTVADVLYAITNPGYQGTTIGGRSSVAIVNAPGGVKVNTFLGSMFLPRRDLRIPGRGLPIEIDLTYNANRASPMKKLVPSWYGKAVRSSSNRLQAWKRECFACASWVP